MMYQANFVPVGQDQVAHVELTREVARRFNSMYKTSVFPEPDALLTPTPKLPGTDGRKMSKSYGNTIGLTDAPAIVAAKILGMSTNGQRVRQTDPGDPELCPIGDMHKIFSSAEVTAATQNGCRTASMRCEFCKIDAADSVCAVTDPFFRKRKMLESRIDETWEMLREQSAKAAVRAEQTMLSVRIVFDLSRDLGSVRRHFVASSEDLMRAHDLSERPSWWDLPRDLRAKELRYYWRMNLLPREIQLVQESNRVFTSLDRELEEPFLTPRRKRVFVTTSRDTDMEDKWIFEIPSRSYEVWTLLCWRNENRWLYDFVVPQKFFAQQFALAKRSLKRDERIQVTVTRAEGNHFHLGIAGQTSRNIDELNSNYEPLK